MAWDYKVNIKQYLNNDDDIVTVAENVAKELQRVPFFVFENLPIQLVSETKAAVERVPDDKEYHQLKFNKVLGKIYDVADWQRVWLGL